MFRSIAWVAVLGTAAGCCRPCPARCAPVSTASPTAAPVSPALVRRDHAVADLTKGDAAAMGSLLEKARTMGSYPGGSVVARGTDAIVVEAPPRVQELVATTLDAERAAFRLRYFDVRELAGPEPTIHDELRVHLKGVEGEAIDLKNGILIVRASSPVLDAVEADLKARRTAKR